MTRIVVCGYGRFGRIYADRARALGGVEVVGVVEVPSMLDRVREDELRPFDSLREALDVAHPSLVVVATPPDQHARLAIEALQRHVNVMLAKPGALGLDEAERITACAWRYQRRLVVDYTPLRAPAWARLRSERWADGILTMRLVRRGVQRYQACGALWDLAPHDVAMAVDLDASDRVVDVAARAWWYPDFDEPVGAFVHLQHASGRTTRIEVDWMAAADERRVEVVEYDRMHVWDQLSDAYGWTRRGYRSDDQGRVVGLWDLEPTLTPMPRDGRDNVTRSLERAIRGVDDTELFREVTRILDQAEASLYAPTISLAA